MTWPDAIPYYALSSGTTSGTSKYIPISRQMLASNQRAALTSLALFLNAHPNVPLFTGRLFFLGGSTALESLAPASGRGRSVHPAQRPGLCKAGDLSGITAVEASPLLRSYTFPHAELALEKDWEKKMRQLAELSSRLPITMLSGVPSWLLVLFDRLKQITGRDRIADVWPRVAACHIPRRHEVRAVSQPALFQKEIGSPDVHFLEKSYPASEGCSYRDGRSSPQTSARLLTDHQLFF